MKSRKSSTERLKEMGFSSLKARHYWLEEHKQEILDYASNHKVKETCAHFTISGTTLMGLKHPERKKDKHPSKAKGGFEAVSPTALANAILDKLTVLQSENLVLKEQNSNLKTRLDYLEGQEAERQEVGEKPSKPSLQR